MNAAQRMCAAFIAVALSGPVLAADPCGPDQKLADCWQQEEHVLAAAAAAAAAPARTPREDFAEAAPRALAAAQQKLLREPVGTAVGVAQTVTQNFLPNYSLAGLGLGKGGESSALRGDLNFALPGADANNGQLRVGAVPKPELAQPVVDALAGAAASVVENLRNRLGPDDDYSGQLTWTFRGSLFGYGFGRDLALYRDKHSALLAAAFPDPDSKEHWSSDLQRCAGRADIWDKTLPQLRNLPQFKADAAHCEELVQQIPARVADQVDRLHVFDANIATSGLDHFADLVNGQPQLTVAVSRTQRDPLVGAPFTAVRVSFETGWTNLDFFEHDGGARCFRVRDDYSSQIGYAGASDECLAAYGNYVRSHSFDAQNRLAAFVEYARLEDLRLQVPEAGVDLTIPGASRLAAGLGLGGTLLAEGEGRSTRIDAFARYERFAGDSLRLDHTTYSVVLTQRVGYLNIPFVLAWSDRSEFRGGPAGLATTLGLGFDFGLPEVPAPPPIDIESRLRTVAP